MNVEQPSHQSAPLLKGSEEQVVKLRKRLEDVFRNVSLAHDVVAICIELSEGNTGDFNPEMAHVLRRCAAERLHFQMEVLTTIQDISDRRAQAYQLLDEGLRNNNSKVIATAGRQLRQIDQSAAEK